MNESSLGYFPSQPIRLWWRSCVEGLREVGNDTRVCLIHILVLSTADQIQMDCQPETLLCLGPVEIYFLPLFLLVEGNCENTTILLSDHHDLPFSYLHELLEFLISKPLWTPAVFSPLYFLGEHCGSPSIYIYIYVCLGCFYGHVFCQYSHRPTHTAKDWWRSRTLQLFCFWRRWS